MEANRRAGAARTLLNSLALLGLAVASACGGGGGGSSGPPANNLVFTPDKTAVTLSFDAGVPSQATVVITASGTYSGTIYVGAQVEGQGISPIINAAIGGTQATFTLVGNGNLVAGDYTGRVALLACSDANCSQQIGNSPVYIAYTVHVLAPMVITPAQVSATAVSGNNGSATFAVALPTGATNASAGILSPTPWAHLTTLSATNFSLAFDSLPSGVYSTTVTVLAGAKSANVPVTYTVTAPPGGDRFMSVAPTGLTFATTEGLVSATQQLAVTPPSWNPQVDAAASYGFSTSTGWLRIVPTGDGFTVSADASNLSAGSYTASVTVTGAYPSTPIVVPVALTVGPGLVRPADQTIHLTSDTPASALAGSVSINVVAGPATTWTASSSANWLLLANPSGNSGDTLQFTIDAARVAALGNGRLHGSLVTITPGRATMTPATFGVFVDKRLAEVTMVTPYVQLAGQPVRVVLRGSGFNGIQNLPARLTVQGGSILSATRVNDTEIVAQVSALSAGDHVVAATNALGMNTTTGTMTTVVPTSFPAAQVPTGGAIPSLAFDARRNALYAANRTLESVMRFRFAGAAWSTDTMSLPAAFDVGLTPDGNQLIFAASSYQAGTGRIGVLDPAAATLASQSSVALANHIEPTFTYLGFGLATTNDGNTLVGVGNQWAAPMRYRAGDGSLATYTAPGLDSPIYSGPWAVTSRDGERMVLVQSASISPTPPMLYMDAADGIFHVNPAGLLFSYHLSMNDDGSRLMLDMAEVRDATFGLVGTLVLPTTPGVADYIARTGVVSPDGTRAYVLAYRSDLQNGGVLPRVFVYDSSTRQATQAALPLLGHFDLDAYPTCVGSLASGSTCATIEIAAAISLDGKTLFFASAERLVVQPVPVVLATGIAAPRLKASRTPQYTPWVLSLH